MAIPAGEDDHVPPDVLLAIVTVPPKHKVDGPVMSDTAGEIVIILDVEQPADVVAVTFTVPECNAENTPEVSPMPASSPSLTDHVNPEVNDDKVTVFPSHTVDMPVIAEGKEFIVILRVV